MTTVTTEEKRVSDLEKVSAPEIGGTLPHDEYIRVLYSIAKSLKRIADSLEPREPLPTKPPETAHV